MKWFWGSLLIIVGLILLSLNLNILNSSQLSQIIQFWPLLLVIYGSSLIFRHWKFGWLIILLAIIGSVGFVGYAITRDLTHSHFQFAPQNNNARSETSFISSVDPSATQANVTINSGGVNLNLTNDHFNLISGKMTSQYLKPELKVTTTNSITNAELNTSSTGDLWPNGKNDLDVKLTDQVPVDLTLHVGASKLNLDLSDIILSGLTINSGATDMDITLGDQVQNNTKINISTGASNLKIKIPQNVGVRLTNEAPLSKTNFENFTQSDSNTFESQNYSSQAKKIELKISAGISTIEVK